MYIDFSNDLPWFLDCIFESNEAVLGSGGGLFIGCKVIYSIFHAIIVNVMQLLIVLFLLLF